MTPFVEGQRKKKSWRYIHDGRGREHVWKIEHVLTTPWPWAVVHHIDGNPRNNAKSNLLICENSGYHSFLHQRIKAYRATGNPRSRRCHLCKRWDLPENLDRPRGPYMRVHKQCDNADSLARYHAKKNA